MPPAARAVQTDAPVPATASKVRIETYARGLQNPWGMQFLPDGRLLVTERPGRLRLIAKDGKLSAPIAGVPAVFAQFQGGLLDVALAPDYATSGSIYFSYSEPREGGKAGTSVARARLALDGDGGRLEGLTVVFRQQPAYRTSHHFGSRLVFTPDGKLFVTLGDRGDMDQAQSPKHHIGKILRINPDGSAPEDNPKLEGWAPEVWSIGHRNVQGAALDPATGRLWTTEHGARGGDELNRPEKGKNYGWPVITYGIDYSGAKIGIGSAKEGLEQPIYYWVPSIATSGLAVYTGDLFPGWKGSILAGGLGGQHLERLVLEGDTVVAHEKLLEGERIRDVRSGPDGAVWVLTDDRDGKVLRLTPGG
jgi:glucose/arabinose dehydrogenase